MPDESLDTFVPSADDEDSDPDDSDQMIDETEDPDSEPAISTYQWSSEGRECADCGATVERRWRDDGVLVCTDCKAW